MPIGPTVLRNREVLLAPQGPHGGMSNGQAFPTIPLGSTESPGPGTFCAKTGEVTANQGKLVTLILRVCSTRSGSTLSQAECGMGEKRKTKKLR